MEKEKISDEKIKSVKELSELIKNSRTIMIVSTKGLPSSQFQAIRKKLKDKAIIKVSKKSVITRAIESLEKGSLMNLKNYIKEDYALIFSKIEPFELAVELAENKSPAKAKSGQIAQSDIEIEPGSTDLAPGPAISEFSSLGIRVVVEDGKIVIKQGKVIVKRDEKISNEAASILNKLDIKPFEVGFEPVVAYDSELEKIYENIKIDKRATLDILKSASVKARAFAIVINYYTKETIGFLLVKAASHYSALEKLSQKESIAEEKEEKKKEGIKEEKAEKERDGEEKVEEKVEKKEEVKKKIKKEKNNQNQEEK